MTVFLCKDIFGHNASYSFNEYNRYLIDNVLLTKQRESLFQKKKRTEWINIGKELDNLKSDGSRGGWIDRGNVLREDFDHESILITTKSARQYSPSEKFIILENTKLKTLRADEISEDDIGNIRIQCMKEIIQNINILEFDKSMVKQLEIYRKSLGYGENDSNERIWKILLKGKATKEGPEVVHDSLVERCNHYNASMVSYNWFVKEWMNPSSESIAPNHISRIKAIRDICNLDNVYVRYLLKLKAAKKINTLNSHNFMIELIDSLIVADCLPSKDNDYSKWCSKNLDKYNFDDYGFSILHLNEEIRSFVDKVLNNMNLTLLRNYSR